MATLKKSRHWRPLQVIAWAAAALLMLHVAFCYWADAGLPFSHDPEFQDRFKIYRSRLTAARSAGRKTLAIVGSSRVEHGLSARVAEGELAQENDYAPLVHNLGFT